MRTPILFALGLLAAGCTTAPSMKLAPELAAIQPKPVTGRNAVLGRGTLKFDRWSSTAPARIPNARWSKTGGMVATGLDEQSGVSVDRAVIEFEVGSNESPRTQSQCIARGRFAKRVSHNGRLTDETAVNIPGYPRFDCAFSGPQAGELSLRPEYVSQRDSGTAEFGEHRFDVRSVNNFESQRSSFPLARFGYEFTSGGKVVAAVETLGNGRVWIDPALGAREQDELAVASTALLYYASLLDYEED